uniref:Uncharacterized protein n=1 Tax=Nelumbo nucifera TaxID=4432 RepID=A0A822ZK34_NELNU|nr:TPA_asm: hypothetical protein HUJ06_003110 [Nelumbo nucifera]
MVACQRGRVLEIGTNLSFFSTRRQELTFTASGYRFRFVLFGHWRLFRAVLVPVGALRHNSSVDQELL